MVLDISGKGINLQTCSIKKTMKVGEAALGSVKHETLPQLHSIGTMDIRLVKKLQGDQGHPKVNCMMNCMWLSQLLEAHRPSHASD